MTIKASLVYALLTATACLVHATSLTARRDDTASDDRGGFGGGLGGGNRRGNFGDYFNDHGDNDDTQPKSLSSADLAKSRNINWDRAVDARTAHAVLASLAFVFLFPVGAIAMRLVPGRLSLFIHAGIQLLALLIYTAAVGLGIWLCLYVKFSEYHLIMNYHPVIGLVVFSLLWFQPIGGILHHIGYKKHGRRTIVSHGHIWLGKILITLGMINGGLGLLLADNASRGQEIAYGVVAGIMWLLWMVASVYGELRRRRAAGPVPVAAHKGNGAVSGHGTGGVEEKDAPTYA